MPESLQKSLKGSVTRKLRKLSDLSKHEFLTKATFEQCDMSLQQTLNDLRLELSKEIYEEVQTDV